MQSTIRIAAAVITDASGRLLLVRKQDTSAFMQPGGKIEPNETPLQALARELREEIGMAIGYPQPGYLGRFSAPAANEVGATVTAELFAVAATCTPTIAAEIAEMIWLDPQSDASGLMLAPLTRDVVLPLWRKRLSRG